MLTRKVRQPPVVLSHASSAYVSMQFWPLRRLVWSNRVVVRQVHRLRLLKRWMYARADFVTAPRARAQQGLTCANGVAAL